MCLLFLLLPVTLKAYSENSAAYNNDPEFPVSSHIPNSWLDFNTLKNEHDVSYKSKRSTDDKSNRNSKSSKKSQDSEDYEDDYDDSEGDDESGYESETSGGGGGGGGRNNSRQRHINIIKRVGITYAWGRWEKWSRCSNSCVQIRKRQCIKRYQEF